jgi:hypothetical protein
MVGMIHAGGWMEVVEDIHLLMVFEQLAGTKVFLGYCCTLLPGNSLDVFPFCLAACAGSFLHGLFLCMSDRLVKKGGGQKSNGNIQSMFYFTCNMIVRG